MKHVGLKQTFSDDLVSPYEAVTFYLDNIEQNDDPHNRFDPTSLNEVVGINKQLKNSAFQVAFHACHYMYGHTKGLSKQLQGSTVEIIRVS